LGFSLSASLATADVIGGAVCTFNPDNGRLEPGVTATSAKGMWQAGPTSFDCHGTVAGKAVTGPGTIVESGPYEGDCLHGTGSGVQRISIPTAGGIVRLEIPINFSYTGPTGAGYGPGMAATFQFTPTSGDCINTPITGYRQLTQEFLTGAT
jgi:hypothetical protein